MMKTIQVSTLRNNLADVIDAVKREKVLVVTRHDDAETALVDLDYLEDLLALKSKRYRKAIKQARTDFAAGRIYTHEEIFGALE